MPVDDGGAAWLLGRVHAIATDVCAIAVRAASGVEVPIDDGNGSVSHVPLEADDVAMLSPLCARPVSPATSQALASDAWSARGDELAALATTLPVWRPSTPADAVFGVSAGTGPNADKVLEDRLGGLDGTTTDVPPVDDGPTTTTDQVGVARDLTALAAAASAAGDMAAAAQLYGEAAGLLGVAAAADDPRADDLAPSAVVVDEHAVVAVYAMTGGAPPTLPEIPDLGRPGRVVQRIPLPPATPPIPVQTVSLSPTSTSNRAASTSTAPSSGALPAGGGSGAPPPPPLGPPSPPAAGPESPPNGGGAGDGGTPPLPLPPDVESTIAELSGQVRDAMSDFRWDKCTASKDDLVRLVVILENALLLGIEDDSFEASSPTTFEQRWHQKLGELLADMESVIRKTTGCDRWFVRVKGEQSQGWDGGSMHWSSDGARAVTVTADGTRLAAVPGPSGALWTVALDGCMTDSGSLELSVDGDILPPATPDGPARVRLHVVGSSPPPPVPPWNGGSVEDYCTQVLTVVFDDWAAMMMTETLASTELVLDLVDGASKFVAYPRSQLAGGFTVSLGRTISGP
jgi:hypothetical protein